MSENSTSVRWKLSEHYTPSIEDIEPWPSHWKSTSLIAEEERNLARKIQERYTSRGSDHQLTELPTGVDLRDVVDTISF
jgi:hypothetical protein